MTLEDHVGDIIRKTRQAAEISVSQAAQAAGIIPADLANLEESGLFSRTVNFEALAKLLGLDGPKLVGIAHGWQPQPVDLSLWRHLQRISTTQDGHAVNAYLVWDTITREGALFDTGWDATPVLALLREKQVSLEHIFITHDHTDHVAALAEIRQRCAGAQLHDNNPAIPSRRKKEPDDSIRLGHLHITKRATPGHSEDGTTYIVSGFPYTTASAAVVGDCIFAGSIGRGFQSLELLRRSVREQILSLPPSTLLCPGHGPLTTVKEELEHNPFC